MKRIIDVHRGEIMAGQGEVVLESDTNGACLVILAYDANHKIGGLAHALYFSGRMDKKWHSSTLRSAAEAIEEMVEDMALIGADRESIEVALVTGENVPHDENDPEYIKNLNSTIEILKQKNIRLRENSAQDAGQHHVALDVESGEVIFK